MVSLNTNSGGVNSGDIAGLFEGRGSVILSPAFSDSNCLSIIKDFSGCAWVGFI